MARRSCAHQADAVDAVYAGSSGSTAISASNSLRSEVLVRSEPGQDLAEQLGGDEPGVGAVLVGRQVAMVHDLVAGVVDGAEVEELRAGHQPARSHVR
jgi:hypothetical protein